MTNKQRLEAEYLKAKIEYYEGTPIMTDAAFDILEKKLKELGSKAHEQVGSKRKDFDFTHPTKMLSLSKHQTSEIDGVIDYAHIEFYQWFDKRNKLIYLDKPLLASPKFDGNAINIIYSGRDLFQILTRGDGEAGKNVTKRFMKMIGNTLTLTDLDVSKEDTIEIRCEVVIKKSIFEKKYASDFANPRNYVAGVIGKDDYDVTKVSELTIVPLQFLVNGNFVAWKHFKTNNFCTKNWDYSFQPSNYIDTIKHFEKIRNENEFQLDGVVIAFPIEYRKTLGVNDHDPEFAHAVKFVPEQIVTTVNGVEWNVGKRGQLTPVVLLDTVQLAGTNVKRASGYNAGYLYDNNIGPGTIVSIAKMGDIIPAIQTVEVESELKFVLPEKCPECETKLEFDGIHLLCPNTTCPGRISKKLATASALLDLKGVGGERLKPFARDFGNMYELMVWVLDVGDTKEIEQYGIAHGGRLHEIFVNSFKNIKSIPYEKVIQLLGYENVGRKISLQLAREHAGLDFSYYSLEKALVTKLHDPMVVSNIKESVLTLESLGITVDRPKDDKESNLIGVVLTGSPKTSCFKTKKEFLAKFPNLTESSLSNTDCKYLITDDLSSTSSKMKQAAKKGIEIKTYKDF